MLDAIGVKPRCPVMAHFGERDAGIPVEGVRKLAAAHPEAQVFIYAADHGFNCIERASYDRGRGEGARAHARFSAPARRLSLATASLVDTGASMEPTRIARAGAPRVSLRRRPPAGTREPCAPRACRAPH